MKEALLALLKDAMRGVTPSPETTALLRACPDVEGLLKKAELHNILPLVGPLVLEALPEYADGGGLRSHIRKRAISQAMATGALCGICEELEARGIPYLVVKGGACRALYPRPEQRPSTDEDILVPPEYISAAEEILVSQGFAPGQREGQVLHFASPLLHVELHRYLTEEEVLEQEFQRAMEAPAWFSVDGKRLRTLPPQEHFLFLAVHFYKHFLTGGVGIRQAADMVLMARQPGICWPRVWSCLQELGIHRLICGVLEIGISYLGLAEEIPEIPPVLREMSPGPEPLLEDMLDAGVFGGSTMERKHSSLVTMGAAQGKGEKSSLLGTVFPGEAQLSGRYPWLKGRPWLLPAAWGLRIGGYVREGGNLRKRASGSATLGKQRVALMGQYGLIPEKQ